MGNLKFYARIEKLLTLPWVHFLTTRIRVVKIGRKSNCVSCEIAISKSNCDCEKMWKIVIFSFLIFFKIFRILDTKIVFYWFRNFSQSWPPRRSNCVMLWLRPELEKLVVLVAKLWFSAGAIRNFSQSIFATLTRIQYSENCKNASLDVEGQDTVGELASCFQISFIHVMIV